MSFVEPNREKPTGEEAFMTEEEVAYIKSSMRVARIVSFCLFLLVPVFIYLLVTTSGVLTGDLVILPDSGTSPLWFLFLIFFCVIVAFLVRKGIRSFEMDLQTRQKEIFNIPITKKDKEDDGDREIDFGLHFKDVDVSKDVFDIVQVEDICVYERAKYSHVVLSVIRKADGLVIFKLGKK
jgi:hypothetical protein